MKTTTAAGHPWVEAPSLPTAATLANQRALGSTIFGATPAEQAVLRDLRDAAAHSRAAAQARALSRAT